MSATLSTPSKNRTASRSQSQNTQNTVEELKEDLFVDIRRSQHCDLDEFLKFNLYSILKNDSAEKKDLDRYQGLVEELERKLDASVRAKAAQENKENAKNQAEGNPSLGDGYNQSDPDITQWQSELDKLRTERQNILDHLLDECLDKVLPICQDAQLREYLIQYSQAGLEADLYSPFVKLSNSALDCLDKLLSGAFRKTSTLNCRFHVNDPKVIKTNYEDSSVSTKPDVIITSTVAAGDVNFQSYNQEPVPEYKKQPKNSFTMQQTLSTGEFKRRKARLSPPLTNYNKIRQSKCAWGDNELSLLYPLSESATAVNAINNEAGEPPAKRPKLDPSEPTGISPAAIPGPSNTSRASKTKRSQGGSRQGTDSNDHTTYYPSDNSKNMIDARTQCAVYGMEMLSYAIGIHHAITFLIIDCRLWVWYYDRQGVIQSNGIDFVQDLPRFLVLLFAFQRFELFDWGVITELNPGAELVHNKTPATTNVRRQRHTNSWNDARMEREKQIQTCTLKKEHFDPDSIGGLGREHLKELRINLNDWLSHKPHCLGGRATAVLGSLDPNDATQGELAYKISFPEIARENEGKIIEELVEEINQNHETRPLSKHLPDVLMYGDMSRYGTQRVRSMLKLAIGGCRTLRVLVSRKLAPLTSVDYPYPFFFVTEAKSILLAQSMHSFGVAILNTAILAWNR